MSVWARVRDWLAPEQVRSSSGGDEMMPFGVNVIDSVAVPGSGMQSTFYRPGMNIPGAWRCALVLSDLIGEMPWNAYRERAGRPLERLDPTPPLLEQPNPQEPRMATFSSATLDLVWEGNAVFVIAARNAEGYPTAALPVPTRMVGVRRNFEGTNLPIGAIEYNVGGTVFYEHDVIHVKGPCEPGAVRGMGVLEAHFETFGLAREQQRQAASISRHGVPTGVLKSTNPDVTEDELKAAKAGWLKSQRERTVAALSPSTEFEPLSWNPEELQLVEARKFTLHELGLIFGLPLSFLGVETSSRTYKNDQAEDIKLVRFSLNGHLTRFEQTLSMHLPHRTWAKANRDSVLESDTLTRYQAHAIALGQGFLTLDEVRDIEDLAPLPTPPVPPRTPDTAGGPQEGDSDE